MTDRQHTSTAKPRTQPLSFLPVSPAKLMLAEGVAEVWSDTELVGAMFKAALQMWVHGPAEERVMFRVIGQEALDELLDAGVIVKDGDLFLIPWVEHARTESDRRRVANAEKGKKGAAARWEKPEDASAMAQPSTGMADDGEDGDLSPSAKKRGRKPSPVNGLWSDLWREHRGMKWAWTKKDAIQLAQILKLADGNLSEVERRARVMFSAKDLWTQMRASCGVLLSQWNTFGVEIVPASSVTVALSGDSVAAQEMYDRFKSITGAK